MFETRNARLRLANEAAVIRGGRLSLFLLAGCVALAIGVLSVAAAQPAIGRVTLDMNGASFACHVRKDFSEASTDVLATAASPLLRVVTDGNQHFLAWPSPFWDFTPQSAPNSASRIHGAK